MANRERTRAADLAQRALTCDPLDAQSRHNVLRVLVAADELDAAGRADDPAIDAARAAGRLVDLGVLLSLRADRHLRAGAVYDAEVDARAAWALARAHDWPMGLPATAANLVRALLERGELDEARTVVTRSGLDAPPAQLPELYTFNWLLEARGALHLACGDDAAAVADLRELGRRQLDWHELTPATIPWRSLLATALARRGELREALRLADEELDLARAFGAPRAIAVALLARAALEPTTSHPLLREAVDILDNSPARLVRARALAALGAAELRDGETIRARTTLLTALDLADSCGATALVRELGVALRAAGARPRRAQLTGPAALTPSERQVARLAADGRSNREIAEALYVTVRTVEWHLSHAYRKLDIRSRRDLPAALARVAPARER